MMVAEIQAGWEIFYVLVAAAAVGFVFVGGLVAWLSARRWQVALLGSLLTVAVASWLRVRFGIAGERAAMGGLVASAAVGLAFRAAADGSDLRRGRRVGAIALVVLVAVAGSAAAIRSSVEHQRLARAASYTASQADHIAAVLAESDATTPHDLAVTVPGPGSQVLEARRRGTGAELVVRITEARVGMGTFTRCWQFDIAAPSSRPTSRPVACPDVAATSIAGNYGDALATALATLPAGSLEDLGAVRRAARTSADQYITGPTRTEVTRLDPGTLGIAVEVGVAECRITKVDLGSGGPIATTWQPDPELLRSDRIGCHPALAVS